MYNIDSPGSREDLNAVLEPYSDSAVRFGKSQHAPSHNDVVAAWNAAQLARSEYVAARDAAERAAVAYDSASRIYDQHVEAVNIAVARFYDGVDWWEDKIVEALQDKPSARAILASQMVHSQAVEKAFQVAFDRLVARRDIVPDGDTIPAKWRVRPETAGVPG